MSFDEFGFELIPKFISSKTADLVLEEIEQELSTCKGGGIRNADKKFSSISSLATSNGMLSHASKYLSGSPLLVRAIVFDKSPSNNWLVMWHQDKTVALTSKFEKSGWGPWSLKDGIDHVQPPLEALENMITFRIHLDESTLKNGCLKVIPESQLAGLLSQDNIYRYVESHTAKIIEAPALSALAMRPHLLHASSKATQPSRRRILHLEYSSYELPSGVSWA